MKSDKRCGYFAINNIDTDRQTIGANVAPLECPSSILVETKMNRGEEAELLKHSRRKVRFLKRKPSKQYHTENQGLRSPTIFLLIDQFKTRRERLKSALYLRLKKRKIFKICSGLLLKFNQVYSAKNTRKDKHKTPKPLFPQLETPKKPFFERKIGIFSFGKNLIVPKNTKGDQLNSQTIF